MFMKQNMDPQNLMVWKHINFLHYYMSIKKAYAVTGSNESGYWYFPLQPTIVEPCYSNYSASISYARIYCYFLPYVSGQTKFR